jgi:hypothetical protein
MSIYVSGNRLASKLFNAFSDVRVWHSTINFAVMHNQLFNRP